MSRKSWLILALISIAALVAAVQSCGKGTGNGVGGVTIYGAGS